MDKKEKNLNVPNLRFPQFKEPWMNYKASELLTTVSTNSLSWEQLTYAPNSSFKNLHYGLIHNGFETTGITGQSNLLPYINPSFLPTKYTLIQDGDLILADASEDRKDVGKPVEMLDVRNQKVVSGLHTIHAKNKTNLISIGFKGFYFQSEAMKKQIFKIANGSKIFGISATNFNELNMCIPSHPEQKIIVDLMGKIESRIQTQIKIINYLRTQEKHIINNIFNDIESKLYTLTNIAEVYQPKTISSNEFNKDGKYPVFGANGQIGKYDYYNHENEQICISCRGASAGSVNLSQQKSWITGNSMVVNLDNYSNIVNKKFIYYQLKAMDFTKFISGSGQPQITRAALDNLKIKVPSLETQNLLAYTLDLVESKINLETNICELYQLQKAYLLKNMFI